MKSTISPRTLVLVHVENIHEVCDIYVAHRRSTLPMADFSSFRALPYPQHVKNLREYGRLTSISFHCHFAGWKRFLEMKPRSKICQRMNAGGTPLDAVGSLTVIN